MSHQAFGCLCKTGSIGIGANKMIPWHKEPREDLLRLLDIRVAVSGPGEDGEKVFKGSWGINDSEHDAIVNRYLDGKSMKAIGIELGRSDATVFKEVHVHNNLIRDKGFCDKCRRVGSLHDTKVITKDKK